MILDNMLFSISTILPIFLLLLLGYILKEQGITNPESVQTLNVIVFKVGLPLYLFREIYHSNFYEVFDLNLILFAVITTLLSFFLNWILAEFFIKEKSSIGAFVQGTFRSNFAVIGLALASSVGGSGAVSKGVLINAFVIPIYNIASVVVLSLRSEQKASPGLRATMSEIAKIPLIRGIACGLLFSLLGIKLPVALESPIEQLAMMATPLAMLGLGGTIEFEQLKNKKIRLALIASAIKVIVIPLVFVPIALLFGFRGTDLLVLYIMYGTPVAVSSYIMACNLKGDGELAADIFIITTLLSVFTFTMGIYLLKSLRLI